MESDPPWQDLLDAGEAGIDTYKALLRFYMQRDGSVTPTMEESPAAHALVEAGEARWRGPLTIVPSGAGTTPDTEGEP